MAHPPRSRAIVTSDIDRVTDRTDELVAAVNIPILAEHVPAAPTVNRDRTRSGWSRAARDPVQRTRA